MRRHMRLHAHVVPRRPAIERVKWPASSDLQSSGNLGRERPRCRAQIRRICQGWHSRKCGALQKGVGQHDFNSPVNRRQSNSEAAVAAHLRGMCKLNTQGKRQIERWTSRPFDNSRAEQLRMIEQAISPHERKTNFIATIAECGNLPVLARKVRPRSWT